MSPKFSFPTWPPARLIAEAVSAYSLRHPDSPIDAQAVDWPKLYAIILAFCRHELSGYDKARLEGADRQKLRSQIHAAIKAKYPWLRADADPRQNIDQSDDPRLLNVLVEQLCAWLAGNDFNSPRGDEPTKFPACLH